jgi:hypothetical protein
MVGETLEGHKTDATSICRAFEYSRTMIISSTYDDAVLEMDLQQAPGRVVEAQKAIEERLRSCIVFGGLEHVAIVNARKALATLSVKHR